MKPRKREAPLKVWSARSQRSWVEQWRLERTLSNCEAIISQTEGDIAKLNETSARLTRAIVESRPVHPTNVEDTLLQTEAAERKLKALKADANSLRSEIKALAQPSLASLAARRKQQAALAQMVGSQLAKDRQIETAIEALRKLLQERRVLNGGMRAAASKIELNPSAAVYNDGPLAVLLDSLPEGIAAGSEAWARSFLGTSRGRKPYTVREACLLLPETLANAHAYRLWDRLNLTDDEARELLASEHPSISPVDPDLETEAVDSESVEVEILSRVEHGIGREMKRYDPGIHTLPRRVALELLDSKRLVPSSAPGRDAEIAVCRIAHHHE